VHYFDSSEIVYHFDYILYIIRQTWYDELCKIY
jgi:hypothetical protein